MWINIANIMLNEITQTQIHNFLWSLIWNKKIRLLVYHASETPNYLPLLIHSMQFNSSMHLYVLFPSCICSPVLNHLKESYSSFQFVVNSISINSVKCFTLPKQQSLPGPLSTPSKTKTEVLSSIHFHIPYS